MFPRKPEREKTATPIIDQEEKKVKQFRLPRRGGGGVGVLRSEGKPSFCFLSRAGKGGKKKSVPAECRAPLVALKKKSQLEGGKGKKTPTLFSLFVLEKKSPCVESSREKRRDDAEVGGRGGERKGVRLATPRRSRCKEKKKKKTALDCDRTKRKKSGWQVKSHGIG